MTLEKLEPAVRDMIVGMASSGLPRLSALSVEGARRQYTDFLDSEEALGSVADSQDYLIDGPGGTIRIRAYQPEGPTPHSLLVWFHGGGWALGDIDDYDDLCRVLAEELGRVVASVEYRLAPEHPFPAGLNDCYTALKWVAENAEAINADPNRIAIGGDSAGGNLAAATALLARNRNGPSIERQLLAYPATSYPLEPGEDAERGYFLEKEDAEWFWSLYLEDRIHGRNQYASPLQATDMTELPPATVVTCQFDPFHYDGVRYVQRLSDAGVPVDHVHFDDVVHGFLPLLDQPRVERAWEAIDRIDDMFSESRQ